MKLYELTEAFTPTEIALFLFTNNREALLIGGRVIRPEIVGNLANGFKKINLKDINMPGHGPLLFHGTTAEFTKFNDKSWFSSEPYTPGFHASFKEYFESGQKFIYACYANLGKVFVASTLPTTDEDLFLGEIYAKGYNSIVWKNISDANVGPNTDLYNIRDGNQVKILKRWKIEEKTVNNADFESYITTGQPLKRHFVVIDPGLSAFMLGDEITKDDYEEQQKYGLKVKPL